MEYCTFVGDECIICECGENFKDDEALQNHLATEHITRKVPTAVKSKPKPVEEDTLLSKYCEVCQHNFESIRAIKLHNIRVHKATPVKTFEASKSVVCDTCGNVYPSKAALKYHKRSHTGERPYKCPYCEKAFAMYFALKIHIRIHTGKRPYQCTECPKNFTNKAALNRHVRVHTGERPYPCPECGKYFTQSNSMKLHVKTVHLKMPWPYRNRKQRKVKLEPKSEEIDNTFSFEQLTVNMDHMYEKIISPIKKEIVEEIQIDSIEDGFAEEIHIDSVEGEFVDEEVIQTFWTQPQQANRHINILVTTLAE